MIKFSEEFTKGIDAALAWCEEEDARQEAERITDEAKRKAFHISYMMAITPVVKSAEWRR
jgi:hypothetical protein